MLFIDYFWNILLERSEDMENWLMLMIVLAIIEAFTINLVTIWFAFGALVTAFVALITTNMDIQLAVFVFTSIIALIATRPIITRLKNDEITPTNLDRVIGKIGLVTEEITKLEPGEVKVDGKRWSAVSKNQIQKDRKVEILSIDGVKLHVKEVEEEK